MNTSQQKINLGEISIDVFFKDIKNIHLSVHPPSGRVRMSSPHRIKLDTLRVFAISKLSWIKKQQVRMKNQEREAEREFITRESHYYLGKRYLLNVIEHSSPPKVEIKHDTIELYVKPNTPRDKRQTILNEWYRERLKELIPPYIEKWEKVMKVKANEYGIKKMKTRWGTCNTKAKRIWINLELAKKPIHCLEYIIVHEMVHLLERKHNDKFKAYMNAFIPQWKQYRQELNRFPITHSDWSY
jgi:predicted metal-dependent hydrolase